MAKRGLSLLLALVMAFSLCVPALAGEEPADPETGGSVQTEGPAEEPLPAPTEEAAPTEDPAGTEAPEPTEEPQPMATETPAPTEEPQPVATEVPVETVVPEETEMPVVTEAPAEATDAAVEMTEAPEITAEPVETPETPEEASLEEPSPSPEFETFQATYINPLYADVVTEADLIPVAEDGPMTVAEETFSSLADAGDYVRHQMMARQNTISFCLETSSFAEEDFTTIIETALAHTRVPKEGDYIRWQFAGWEAGAKGSLDGYAVTYSITYYTTADQEAWLDGAVANALSGMDLASKNDYERIRAIYDYICSNVTYDYVHLNDSSYKLQFTAYAAMYNHTCVCQGYANLLYRMALSAGVDCRIITSIDHAWNIVKMYGQYYNLDSTWDSGRSPWDYFLLCDSTFKNDDSHIREAPWDSAAFYAQYPMASTDYVPGSEPGGVNPLPADPTPKPTASPTPTPQPTRTPQPVDPGSGDTPPDPGSGDTPVDPSIGDTPQPPVVPGQSKPAQPKVSKVTNVAGGVTVAWNAVPGATAYTVYYKTGAGKWKALADTTETSYTWTKAKSGTKYTFSVQAMNSAGNSGYNKTGKSITYMAAPKVKSAKIDASGVKITWAKVNGAAKYQVMYRVGDGKWKVLAKSATGTSYTWKKAKSGTSYTFSVRAVAKDGSTGAYNETGKSLTYIAAPKVKSAKKVSGGIKITWGKVNGAAKYQVMYKVGNGKWKQLTTTDKKTFTWKKAKNGTKYTFSVRAVTADGTKGVYNTTGKSLTYKK